MALIYELHRNVYKICIFFATVERLLTSKISSTCPTGWIIYQNMRETWEKKVMKFQREIPIGLDARRKNDGGGQKPPPPNGIRLRTLAVLSYVCAQLGCAGQLVTTIAFRFRFRFKVFGKNNWNCEAERTCMFLTGTVIGRFRTRKV